MSNPRFRTTAARPPTQHQLAVMIWLAVFPTLTVLNLALGGWLHNEPRRAHLHARDHRRADRQLRTHAPPAQNPCPHPRPDNDRGNHEERAKRAGTRVTPTRFTPHDFWCRALIRRRGVEPAE